MRDETYLLPYNDEKTDDDPLAYVVMSQSFLKFVRGLVIDLLGDDAWDTVGDIDAATFQADDALARLLGEDVDDLIAYSESLIVDYTACEDLSTYGLHFLVTATQRDNGFYAQTTPVAYEQIVKFRVALSAGFWYVGYNTYTSTAVGKFRWKVDGAYLSSAFDMDGYSSSPVANLVKEAPVEILESGLHEFILENTGKNPASGGYYVTLGTIFFRRFL